MYFKSFAYTENKRVIKVWHSTDSISSLVMPYNTRFIRISTTNVSVTLKPTTNLRRESDIVTSAYHATSENSVIVKSGNEIHINNNDLCNRWRLFCKFKLNGYIEGAGELKICELSGNDTYEVGIDGQPNSLMPITANGITSVYPIPKRNSRYYGRKNSLTRQQTGELSLPAYNEVIGKDLFTIQYVGVASSYDYDVDNANVQSAYEVLSDKLFLSLVNNTLIPR